MPRESKAVSNYKARLRAQKQKHKPKQVNSKKAKKSEPELPPFQTSPKKGAKRSRVRSYAVNPKKQSKSLEKNIARAREISMRTPRGIDDVAEFAESIDDVREYQEFCPHPAGKRTFVTQKKVPVLAATGNEYEKVELTFACNLCGSLVKE